MINLLMDLQARFRLTYLLIAHDLRLVEHVCTRVAVMFLGRIVEMGPTREIFTDARHPYTQALLSAVPTPDPDAADARVDARPEIVRSRGPAARSRGRTLCCCLN